MMPGDDETGRPALTWLVQAMVDDVMDMSDEEILAEHRAEGGDAAKLASASRSRLEQATLKARKGRLASVQAELAASKALPPRQTLGGSHNARSRLARALAACPPEAKLTLAARNESELSDADVLGMLEDLAELGVNVPDDD